MVRMYVRRVIFKKLAGTEIDFFVFLLSTRSSSIKSLSVENNMVMAIWSYHGTWYHGTMVPVPMVPVHCITKITFQNKNAHRIILYSSYAYSNLSAHPKLNPGVNKNVSRTS